jgi:hypothetical protein
MLASVAPQNTLVIDPIRIGVSPSGLAGPIGNLAVSAHDRLAIADDADDERRGLRLQKNEGSSEVDGFR